VYRELHGTENTCRSLGSIRGAFVERHRDLNSNVPEYSDCRTAPRNGTEDGGFLPNPSLRIPYSDAIQRPCRRACAEHSGMEENSNSIVCGGRSPKSLHGRAAGGILGVDDTRTLTEFW
jgi:hypothetical protein